MRIIWLFLFVPFFFLSAIEAEASATGEDRLLANSIFQIEDNIVHAVEVLHADLNIVNGHGDSPLSINIWKGNLRMAKFLLQKGADPDFPGNKFAPLFYAHSLAKYDLLRSFGARLTPDICQEILSRDRFADEVKLKLVAEKFPESDAKSQIDTLYRHLRNQSDYLKREFFSIYKSHWQDSTAVEVLRLLEILKEYRFSTSGIIPLLGLPGSGWEMMGLSDLLAIKALLTGKEDILFLNQLIIKKTPVNTSASQWFDLFFLTRENPELHQLADFFQRDDVSPAQVEQLFEFFERNGPKKQELGENLISWIARNAPHSMEEFIQVLEAHGKVIRSADRQQTGPLVQMFSSLRPVGRDFHALSAFNPHIKKDKLFRELLTSHMLESHDFYSEEFQEFFHQDGELRRLYFARMLDTHEFRDAGELLQMVRFMGMDKHSLSRESMEKLCVVLRELNPSLGVLNNLAESPLPFEQDRNFSEQLIQRYLESHFYLTGKGREILKKMVQSDGSGQFSAVFWQQFLASASPVSWGESEADDFLDFGVETGLLLQVAPDFSETDTLFSYFQSLGAELSHYKQIAAKKLIFLNSGLYYQDFLHQSLALGKVQNFPEFMGFLDELLNLDQGETAKAALGEFFMTHPDETVGFASSFGERQKLLKFYRERLGGQQASFLAELEFARDEPVVKGLQQKLSGTNKQKSRSLLKRIDPNYREIQRRSTWSLCGHAEQYTLSPPMSYRKKTSDEQKPCSVCYTLTRDNFFSEHPGHQGQVLCRDCVVAYLESSLNDKQGSARCPFDNCEEKPDVHDLDDPRLQLSKELLLRWKMREIQESCLEPWEDMKAEWKQCLGPDCSNFHLVPYEKYGFLHLKSRSKKSPQVTCEHCEFEGCLNCGEKHPENQHCEKFNIEKILEEGARQGGIFRPCYYCGLITEKVSGCNSMHCSDPACGAHWHWVHGTHQQARLKTGWRDGEVHNDVGNELREARQYSLPVGVKAHLQKGQAELIIPRHL